MNAATSSPTRMLLVHGAWHGAWCWERQLAPLRRLGHDPEAIDLPSHKRSGGSLADLHRDADAVRVQLDGFGEPTLLVGHSYGGMVITDAGLHDAVTGLVYVCAFLPDAGQSLIDAGPSQQRPEGEPLSELISSVRFDDEGSTMSLEGKGIANALYGDCDAPTQQWALERLGPQPTATFTQATRQLAWKSKPTTYVVCTEDRTIPAWNQRRMAERATRVVELPSSHSPFLSMPDRLAELLAGAARASVDSETA